MAINTLVREKILSMTPADAVGFLAQVNNRGRPAHGSRFFEDIELHDFAGADWQPYEQVDHSPFPSWTFRAPLAGYSSFIRLSELCDADLVRSFPYRGVGLLTLPKTRQSHVSSFSVLTFAKDEALTGVSFSIGDSYRTVGPSSGRITTMSVAQARRLGFTAARVGRICS